MDNIQKIVQEILNSKFKPTHIWGISEIDGVEYYFHGDHCCVLNEECDVCDERNKNDKIL